MFLSQGGGGEEVESHFSCENQYLWAVGLVPSISGAAGNLTGSPGLLFFFFLNEINFTTIMGEMISGVKGANTKNGHDQIQGNKYPASSKQTLF